MTTTPHRARTCVALRVLLADRALLPLAMIGVLGMIASCGVRVGNPKHAGTGIEESKPTKRTDAPYDSGPFHREDDAPEVVPAGAGPDTDTWPTSAKDAAGGNVSNTPVTSSMPGDPMRTPETTPADTSSLGSGNTPRRTGVTFVDVALSTPVPTGARALVVRVAAITFHPRAREDGGVGGAAPTSVTLTLVSPVEIDLLAPGALASPHALEALPVPVGSYGSVTLSLDIGAPCQAIDGSGHAAACRAAPGATLEFATAQGFDVTAGRLSLVTLTARGDETAWAFPEWNKPVQQTWANEGVKVVLPTIPGTVTLASPSERTTTGAIPAPTPLP